MVITSLLTELPLLGNDLVYLLWGGYAIQDFTLARFYSLHFMLPFLILGLTILHIALLHEVGSNNPTGVVSKDNVLFAIYYIVKDLLGILIGFILVCGVIFVAPDYLGHVDNYDKANFLVTPPHIAPE